MANVNCIASPDKNQDENIRLMQEGCHEGSPVNAEYNDYSAKGEGGMSLQSSTPKAHSVVSPNNGEGISSAIRTPRLPNNKEYHPVDLEDQGRRPRRIATKQCDFLLKLLLVVIASLGFAVMFRSRLPSINVCSGWRKHSYTLTKLPTHFTLPSGDKIPSVALGVWRAERGKVGDAVKTALNKGYRHIDGAWIYGNEVEVGQAIRDSGVPRKDVWITSKLWNTFHAPEDIEPTLDESLSRLGTEYLDLYLIHWPIAFQKGTNKIDWDLTNNPYPTWRRLEELVESGKIKNIGISNFNIQRIRNLTANPLKIQPAVNQVELSYWNPQPELLQWSKENGLLLEAYSPLGSAEKVKESLQVPEVKHIAKQLGITPAQVYISWHVQRGTVVLPKSVKDHTFKVIFQISCE